MGDWIRSLSPRSQATQKARGASAKPPHSFKRVALNDVEEKYIPEQKSTADETEDLSQKSEEDYPVVRAIGSHLDLTDLPNFHVIDAGMDLEFVEYFDNTYNEFIVQYPEFLAENPELVHTLRILKLQKLLEYNETLERSLKGKKERLQVDKEKMEESMHEQLKEAARKKAARQTFLQSELNNLSWSTKRVKAKLRWKFLEYSKDRAKRQFKLRQQYQAIPQAHNRRELIALIPSGREGQVLRDAVESAVVAEGSRDSRLSQAQEDKLREYQAENSVLSSELAILKKKRDELQKESKKFAWVESILVRLDEGTMYKLKTKFQKKEGLSSF